MAFGIRASGNAPDAGRAEQRPASGFGSAEQAAVLSAVREDVRQTLRSGWVDPAIDAAAAHPVFFAAAWTAIRPNVSKSFLLLARALRAQAAEAVQATGDPVSLRHRFRDELGDVELRRAQDAARAAHLVTVKVQIVVHALLGAVRRERAPGTGREEPPVRRGVPDWQRWMSFQPAPEPAPAVLEQIDAVLGFSPSPTALRLLARWPGALAAVWGELEPVVRTEGWTAGGTRLRRTVLGGMGTLPHPVALQWAPLLERGFGEPERAGLAEALAGFDAAMPAHSLAAAYCWLSLGGPEVGSDG